MSNKFHPGREEGSENRKNIADRNPEERKHEVAQRGGTAEQTAAQPAPAGEHPKAPAQNQTSGYGNREDRENPGKGLQQQQSGEVQSQQMPGKQPEGRAMSQNGARISDFAERPKK